MSQKRMKAAMIAKVKVEEKENFKNFGVNIFDKNPRRVTYPL